MRGIDSDKQIMGGVSLCRIQEVKRINWVDWFKVIGIFLIVIGHTYLSEEGIIFFLFTFHVPLFFFVSGYLEKRTPCCERTYLIKIFNTLIIPYIIWNILSVFFATPITWKGILLFLAGLSIWNAASWFIGVLIIIKLSALLFNNKHYIAFALYMALLIVFQYFGKKLPFFANLAFMYLPFFYLGMLGHNFINKLYERNGKRSVANVVFFVAGIVLLLMIFYFTPIPHTHRVVDFSPYIVLYWLSGIVGCFTLLFFSFSLDKFILKRITSISTATLFIMCSHYEIIQLATKWISHNYNNESALLFSIVFFGVQCMFVPLVLKHAPILAGRQRK